MGRNKSYDREDVLDRAMRLFWRRGYSATSTRDLADAMGVNVYSLYAEFGSKEALYAAALRRYDERVVSGHFGRLEVPEAGLDAVREVLCFFGEVARENNPMLGCLLTNTIAELAPVDAASRQLGEAYVRRLIDGFEHALGNAVASGELRPETPVAELASFLTVSLLGVFVMLRGGTSADLRRNTSHQMLAHLASFEPTRA